MNLSEQLASLHKQPNNRRSCLMGTILAKLPDTDRKALVEVLANRSISNARISATLKANELVVNETTIGKHRNQNCSCDVAQ